MRKPKYEDREDNEILSMALSDQFNALFANSDGSRYLRPVYAMGQVKRLFFTTPIFDDRIGKEREVNSLVMYEGLIHYPDWEVMELGSRSLAKWKVSSATVRETSTSKSITRNFLDT